MTGGTFKPGPNEVGAVLVGGDHVGPGEGAPTSLVNPAGIHDA